MSDSNELDSLMMQADLANKEAREAGTAPDTKKQRDQLLWALEYVSAELRDARSEDLDGFSHELLLRVVEATIEKATKS